MVILQGVVEELVHLCDLGRDGQVDGSVADLDNETTDDFGVNLVCHLELLALADVGGLGNGGLEAGESLVVELLDEFWSVYISLNRKKYLRLEYAQGGILV